MGDDWKNDWDFGNPEASAAAFERRLAGADPRLTLVLQTQIARTWGLSGQFDRARELLRACEADRDRVGGEAVVRWWLEWGRTYASATHGPGVTDADRQTAQDAYERAFEAAKAAGLDGLATDALHMMTLTVTGPADQVAVNRRALAFALASPQEDARSWEAPLRNNLGMALQGSGDLEGALGEFRLALKLREAQGDGTSIRVAQWMVAWILRLQGKLDDARVAQEALEAACAAAGEPDPYVFEELETLHRALGHEADAQRYAGLLKDTRGS